MLYTVAEIAHKLSLSKQTVYVKVRVKEFAEHITKKKGVSYIDQEGFNLIKDSLTFNSDDLNDSDKDNDSVPLSDEVATDTEPLSLNQSMFNLLKQQIEDQSLIIHELNDRLKQEQELNKNSQILQLKQQPQENIKLLETHFEELDSKLEEVKSKMLDRKTQEKQKSFFGKTFKNND